MQVNRRAFLKTTVVAAALSTVANGLARGDRPMPNILMIVPHDLGRHLGCYGVPTVHTPNLDGLAAKGRRFENFYSTSAVCSPGRGSLHTGRYPQSNGLMGLTHGPWWWRIHDDERHTAQILGEAGYETVLAGFNHIGNPERLGYARHVSPKSQAPETVAAVRDLFANREPGDRPLFVKAGFVEVHRTRNWRADEEKGVFVPGYLQDTPAIRADLAEFQGSIRYFDERVGEMIKAVERSAVVEDTLIVFTSDHGIPYPGAKWTCRHAGLENPFILYQPGTVFSGGKAVSPLMSNVDVLPTLLDYLGLSIPENVQGVSFLPYLQDETKTLPRDAIFGQYTPDMKRDNQSRCIRLGKHYLIRYFDQGRSVDYPVDVDPVRFAQHQARCATKGTRPFAQLYDMDKDPWQLNDIGGRPENAGVVEELSRRLLQWMREVDDPLLKGPLRYPYYERAMADFTGPAPMPEGM